MNSVMMGLVASSKDCSFFMFFFNIIYVPLDLNHGRDFLYMIMFIKSKFDMPCCYALCSVA